jgi:hypothetical protein
VTPLCRVARWMASRWPAVDARPGVARWVEEIWLPLSVSTDSRFTLLREAE